MPEETDILTEQPTAGLAAGPAVTLPPALPAGPAPGPQGAGSWQLILVPIVLCLAMMLYVSLI